MESYAGMSQKEIIKRVIEFRDPPRIGMRFTAEGGYDNGQEKL